MRRLIPYSLATALTLIGLSGIAQADPLVLDTQQKKFSYSLGILMGKDLQASPMPIEISPFLQGVRDQVEGNKPLLTSKEQFSVRKDVSRQLRKEESRKARSTADSNLKQAEQFLADNLNKPGVKVTASGLQYKILKQGKGAVPQANSSVTVHYKGTLLNGTEFDSSYKRNQPATFPVNGVIAGWTEALQLMPVGSQYQLFIHPKLGYGERGAGKRIGPNALLVFEVELLNLK
ncbi:MAG: FKBP-type peptidyl-prolyl cis-trans isomerase [Magnetococcales bacterium]|nr:FKBP-type peptidyl-prolyl cis-trans isomerase [Magnetococcales bacterium]